MSFLCFLCISVLTLPLCGVLGTLFGAFMTSRCKFTLKDSGRLMTICSVAVALAVSGLINVSCPPVNWASDTPVVQLSTYLILLQLLLKII